MDHSISIARFAAALALAGGLAAQEGRFGGTASVVVVEVPVNVTKDGKPVRGLAAENFEVFDGKTKQRLTGFEVVDLALLAAPGPAAPPPRLPLAARRHFLFLFDLTFAQPKSILQAREAALGLVRSGLHPTDLAAVATYSASRGSEIVLGFTADRRQVQAAIEGLGLPQLLERTLDPLRLVIAMIDAEAGGLGATQGVSRERLATEDHFYEMQRLAEASYRRSQEVQIAAVARSFTELAGMMGAVDGRKYVVYLSEGFASAAATGRGGDDKVAAASETGEVWKIDSEKVYGSARVRGDLVQMLDSFRRADCLVHAVDIGGVRTAGPEAATELRSDADAVGSGRDTLLTMAHYTGGELYQNFNDLAAAMAQMLDRTGVTYLLSFEPADLRQDGAFHDLSVRLKGGPRGARVHHRAGYYAPDPRRAVDPRERRLRSAAAILGGVDGGALPVAVLALGLPAAATVPVVLEVDGPALLAGHVARRMEVEIYAYALDARQAVRGYLTQQVEIDLDLREAELRSRGLKFYGDLTLPPGEYSLRVLVRNAATGAQGLRTVPIQVPGAAAAGPVVLPPLFFEATGEWLLARETPPAGEPSRADPWLADGRQLMPAARPVLAAGAEAPVALLVYNLGGEQAQVRATVLDAQGRPVAGGKLSISGWQRGEDGTPGRMRGSFTAAGLAPGEYLLRVTVSDPASGAAHSSAAPFVVGAGT